MSRAFHRVAGALIAGVVCNDVPADVVHMTNGDRITGDVKRVWDQKLFIDPEYGDEFSVDLDAVARIESDEDFEIELHDHSEVTARFAADDAGNMLLVTDAETKRFAPTDIEELEEPEEDFDWEARSDLSFSASRGNTNTTDFLWQAQGEVKLGDHRNRFDLGFDRKKQDGSTSKEQYNLSYFYSWFFADRWFLAAGVGYERDPIRALTHRYTYGTGLGYEVFSDADRLLEVSLAAVGIRERIAGVTEDAVSARWELRYRREMPGDLEFFHDHQLSSYVTGRSNELADTTTGIRWEIWSDVYLNVQLDWDWESDPAAGSEREDLTYALGIGVELD